ncbi:hypothetical protein [Candidatus Bathycorpusculum sp.]|uniref:hypothetical protein n=1 Tax=Candidatus Bathycorpusculum sp. TaxID=2994959 RepID=UPI002839B7F4|nr:hypothetical protein [Candidatus Termitimicrobium sp.]MCL2432783.1 hypothetical protein [Candidatus Termitimicrobium sp.]
MTFIPKPASIDKLKKMDKFTPIKPAFRNRQYGGEFNKWEFDILKEFAYAKKSTTPSVSGIVVYDGKLGRNRFLMIPAAHLPQDYIICECPPDVEIPSNLSYVTVTGQKSIFYDYWEIMVDDIIPAKISHPIKPEIDFKEFQQQLFLQWSGIFSPQKDLLAFEFVSSPPLLNLGQAGGLSITLYDESEHRQTNKLFKYFFDLLPPDIAHGKSGNLTIPELAVEQPLSPFTWQFRSFSADKPLNQNLVTFLDRRKSKRFTEVSIGLGSRRNQPRSIYDPPLRLVDQPTILQNSAEMRPMRFDPPLDVTKYIVTMQMLFPTVGKTQEDLNNTLEKASQKILNIAEKYDLPQEVQRHGIFDANYYGKPQSSLRLALSSARSQQIPTVDDNLVYKAIEDFYVKNIENIFEAWDDLFTSKGIELVSLSEFDRQVLKFITEKETSEIGVSYYTLSEKFGAVKTSHEIELRDSIRRLLGNGKIIESKREIYRAIPFVQ